MDYSNITNSYTFWDPRALISFIVSVSIITLVERAVITTLNHAMVLALMALSHVVTSADLRTKGIFHPPDHIQSFK